MPALKYLGKGPTYAFGEYKFLRGEGARYVSDEAAKVLMEASAANVATGGAPIFELVDGPAPAPAKGGSKKAVAADAAPAGADGDLVEAPAEIPAFPDRGFKTKKDALAYAAQHLDVDLGTTAKPNPDFNENVALGLLTERAWAIWKEKFGVASADDDDGPDLTGDAVRV